MVKFHTIGTRRGFSLVELLMIVAILVALLAITRMIIDPLKRKGEAYDSERTVHTRQIYKAINDYLWAQNYPPPDFPTEGNPKWICPYDPEGVKLFAAACTDPPVNGVDLKFLVTDGYAERIPWDPVYANEKSTGFRLKKEGDYYIADAPYTGVYNPLPDPIAWWKLDEGTVGEAIESINSMDGTHINMTTFTSSTDVPSVSLVDERSLIFDGVDDYIEIADDDLFDPTDKLSIAAWVKGAGVWGTSSNADVILRKGNTCAPGVVWEFAVTDGGRPTLILDGCEGGANNNYKGGTLLPIGEWQHVAAVWDGATVSIFVNGALTGGPFTHTTPIGTDMRKVYIGGRREPAGGAGFADLFGGSIDDVRLYDTALTAEQVRLIAEGLL